MVGVAGSWLLPLDLPLTQSDSPKIWPLQGLGVREEPPSMPSPVLPPSSLAALVSRLYPPHTASGPDEPQFSDSWTQDARKEAQLLGDLSPSPNSRQADPRGPTPISPESPAPLNMGPQEVLGEGKPDPTPARKGVPGVSLLPRIHPASALCSDPT